MFVYADGIQIKIQTLLHFIRKNGKETKAVIILIFDLRVNVIHRNHNFVMNEVEFKSKAKDS